MLRMEKHTGWGAPAVFEVGKQNVTDFAKSYFSLMKVLELGVRVFGHGNTADTNANASQAAAQQRVLADAPGNTRSMCRRCAMLRQF